MKGIAAAFLTMGIFFAFSGGANWFFAISMRPHDLCLLGIGLIMLAFSIPALVIIGIKYLRQRLRQSHKQLKKISS